MREQVAGADRQISALKTQLVVAPLIIEELTGEASQMQAVLLAQLVAVKESIIAIRARVKCLDRDAVAMAKKEATVVSKTLADELDGE